MLQIIMHKVAFLEEAKVASGLPHTTSWWEAFLTAFTSSKRVRKLASCAAGSGHDKFLSGICVFVVLRAGHHFWLQWMEYHFRWAVSSASKMHQFPEATEEDIESLPIGFSLTQAHVVNYRQLKTMYAQRRTHRLRSWQIVCDWIETLPDSHLITGKG
jgi:hypothetical protein